MDESNGLKNAKIWYHEGLEDGKKETQNILDDFCEKLIKKIKEDKRLFSIQKVFTIEHIETLKKEFQSPREHEMTSLKGKPVSSAPADTQTRPTEQSKVLGADVKAVEGTLCNVPEGEVCEKCGDIESHHGRHNPNNHHSHAFKPKKGEVSKELRGEGGKA